VQVSLNQRAGGRFVARQMRNADAVRSASPGADVHLDTSVGAALGNPKARSLGWSAKRSDDSRSNYTPLSSEIAPRRSPRE